MPDSRPELTPEDVEILDRLIRVTDSLEAEGHTDPEWSDIRQEARRMLEAHRDPS